MNSDTDVSALRAPQYARFSRRLRAMLLDWIIALVVIFGAVLLAVTVRNDGLSRGLGFLVVVILLLYEPILVSRMGGTLGHYFTNLRVADEGSGDNIGFARACARVVIKGVLGLYSFAVMAATRRNQAVHDLLTRSTVQIRDAAKAAPHQYVVERAGPAAAGMPSRMRRAVVTCVHLLLMAILYFLVVGLFIAKGAVSNGCLDRNFCSGGERILSLCLAVALLGSTAACITLGWRGKLIGARRASGTAF